MKQHSLERVLIYTNKNDLSEFDIPEVLSDQLYELYVTTKDDILDDQCTSVDFFNEVFYYLTCIYANKHAAENINSYLYSESALLPAPPEFINPQTKQELKAAREFEDRTEEINSYVLSFVWVILKKQKELPKHVRFFLTALDHALDGVENFNTFRDFVEKNREKYSLSFEIKPQVDFDEFAFRSTEEWKNATHDFDKEVVEHIVRRFYDVGDRKFVVGEIRDALADANKDANSDERVSMMTYRKKANDVFLDKLLKETGEEEAQRIAEAKVIEKSKDDTIKELQDSIAQLKKENKELIRERDHWKNDYEYLVNKIKEKNQLLQQKKVPSEFRVLPGSEIIQQLVNEGIISILHLQNSSEVLYKWEDSKKLFGYFVERVSDELSLRKSGKSGNIIWDYFMKAFYNAEDLRHEAASAISAMKKKGALMPDGADKIEEAIKYAEAMAMQYKD